MISANAGQPVTSSPVRTYRIVTTEFVCLTYALQDEVFIPCGRRKKGLIMSWSVRVVLGLATVVLIVSNMAIGSETLKLQCFDIPKTNLQVDLPKDWAKGGISGESVLGSFRAGKGLYPNVNITLEDHRGKTIEEVAKECLDRLPSAEIHYQKKETLNGLEAVVSDASWRSILGGLRAVRLVTGYRGKILAITFVDKSANMTEPKRETYLKCLRSLAPSKP